MVAVAEIPENVDMSSFGAFSQGFPLHGERLYEILFDRHSDVVQTQKAKFAVANLEKILTATFEISSKSGFDKMSLRDLSKRTDMSMGAIYSCISKKEDIALMVADIVRLSSELTREYAMKANTYWEKIEHSIRFHLYASTLLQPWYFFLYFETRSLPEQQQLQSKQIELDGIKSFEDQIKAGVAAGEFHASDATMTANAIVVLLEDWYLKPWKTPIFGAQGRSQVGDTEQDTGKQEERISTYYQSLIQFVKKLLSEPSDNRAFG